MNWKKTTAAILVIVCAIFAFLEQDLLFVNPFTDVTLESIVYVSKDAKDNTLILDSAGERLLKVDASNTLQWEAYSSDDGFGEAKRVVSSQNGHIFIQDVIKEQSGFRISGERIVEYTEDGEFLGVVSEYNYEEAVLAPYICGIFPTEDGISYIYKDEDSFQLCGRDGSAIESCSLPHARQYAASFAMDRETGDIYYSTYKGKVFRYVDGTEDILLYDCADSEELSIPKEISVDLEHNLYIADIGLRDVLKIDGDGNLSRIEEDMDLYEKEIAYYLNADYGLIVCTNYSVKVLENGEYQYITSYARDTKEICICVGLWIAVGILAAALLAMGFMGIRYLIRMSSKFAKIAMALVVGVVGIAAIFMGILVPRFQNIIMDAVFSRAQLAAEITAEKLPVQEFSRLDSADDFMGEDYRAVRNAVNNIFLADSENIYDLYCTLYRIEDEIITSVYCLQEDTGAVYPYDWEYEGSDEQMILNSKEGKTYQYAGSEGSYLFVLNPILDANGEAVGLIEVGTDLDSFQRQSREIVFDLLVTTFAITVVIILIAIELILFFRAKMRYDRELKSSMELAGQQDGAGLVPIPVDILRMVVFAIFFLTNIATGFLPIYAMKLSGTGGIPGIPAEVLAAIPISAEVITGAVFSILGNKVVKGLGEKKAVTVSGLLFMIGFGLRIVPNIWFLTLGNAIIGVGWGVLLLMVNTMIALKPEEEKDKGFASYSVAALNGVNCGVVFGGFLINWLSYQWILIFSTALSFFVYFIAKKYLSHCSLCQETDSENAKNGEMSTFAFLRKGRILAYFVLIVIPVIACGYFLNYMFPILASDYGMKETNIGYSYLLNGLCVMCLSNVLTRFFSTKVKKERGLVSASVLYAVAFLVVAWYQNIPSLLIALVLLGISDSFGLPLQNGYYTDLDEVKRFGYDRAMGVYSLFENGAQAAGSFVFSYVLLIGVREGLCLVAGIILVLAVIFLIAMGIESVSKRKHTSVS